MGRHQHAAVCELCCVIIVESDRPAYAPFSGTMALRCTSQPFPIEIEKRETSFLGSSIAFGVDLQIGHHSLMR